MTVVNLDLAANGRPPEGEKGTSYPGSTYWPGEHIFGAYDQWTGTLKRDPTARQLADMLDRDGKAEQLANVLTAPAQWADLIIEPAEGDSGEAELVNDALLTPSHQGGMSTPLDHVIAQMSAAVWQRVAFFEKVWRPEGDRATYKKLAWRPAETCRIKRDEKHGDFLGFQQRAPLGTPGVDADGFILIEPDKALVYIHNQARDPLNGRSALRTAYTAYEGKQKLRYLWFTFLARFATPWGVTTDPSNDLGTARELARSAGALKGGGILGLKGEEKIELLEPTADGGAFQKCMDWLSAEMSGSVMAGFTDLTQQGSGKGSFALSKDQSDFFLRVCEARSSEMAAVLTNYVVADLIRWNFGAAGRTPTIRFRKLSDQHAAEATALLTALLSQPVPDPRVPPEFFDLVLEAVAATLGPKAADVIHRAIEERKAQSPVDQLNGVAGQAAQLVQDAGLA